MPCYDYTCSGCGLEVDIDHGVNDKTPVCPGCGKRKLKRAWRQVAAFITYYSPLHPKRNRGIGNTGRRKT
jgi:putative FmdB family regulatory protein